MRSALIRSPLSDLTARADHPPSALLSVLLESDVEMFYGAWAEVMFKAWETCAYVMVKVRPATCGRRVLGFNASCTFLPAPSPWQCRPKPGGEVPCLVGITSHFAQTDRGPLRGYSVKIWPLITRPLDHYRATRDQCPVLLLQSLP
jgi:hypothetical protein